MELHKTRVWHGRLGLRHITFNKDVAFIIGFDPDFATVDKECSCQERTDEETQSILIAPRKMNFGCDELHDLLVDLELWAPRT